MSVRGPVRHVAPTLCVPTQKEATSARVTLVSGCPRLTRMSAMVRRIIDYWFDIEIYVRVLVRVILHDTLSIFPYKTNNHLITYALQ